MKCLKFILYTLIISLAIPPFALAQHESPKKKEGYRVKMDHFRVKKKDFKKYRYLRAGGSVSLWRR